MNIIVCKYCGHTFPQSRPSHNLGAQFNDALSLQFKVCFSIHHSDNANQMKLAHADINGNSSSPYALGV